MKTGHLQVYIFMSFLFVKYSFAQTTISANQGFSMKVQMSIQGTLGRQGYAGGAPQNTNLLGLEYPVGQLVEHLLGAGIWVGGKLDTARVGNTAPIKLASLAYEGWAGPLYEFYPGLAPADTIWKVYGRGVPRSPTWESYWGNSIPRSSVSDNDFYMMYDDYTRRVVGHVPLNLKVIQSSFVWNDSTAEAIQIIEYKIMNNGTKTIDSAYVGFFADGDIGQPTQSNYWLNNYSGYLPTSRTAYVHNPLIFGTTPFGVSVLKTPRPFDSLRFAFRWFPGTGTPYTDRSKYEMLSSGIIQPDEYPAFSTTRFLLSSGPFTIRPITHASPDTLILAFALVAGQTVNQLNTRALHARQIYTSAVQSGIPSQSDFDRKAILSTGGSRR